MTNTPYKAACTI